MQAFGPPDEGPFQGLVASRIETYGGRHRASAQSTPGSLYPRGGPVLVSPGCTLKVTWVGQEGEPHGFQASVPLPDLVLVDSSPHPCLLSWAVTGTGLCWARLPPGMPHPTQTEGAGETESPERPGPQTSC